MASSPQPSATRMAANKAASLLNFLGYAEWPASAFVEKDAPWRVGVLGDDGVLLAQQQAAQGRKVAGRAVEVLRLRPDSAKTELESLHLIFVGAGHSKCLPQLASSLAGRPVLLVSENGRALEQGSVINLNGAHDKVGFDVSLPAAQRRGLTLSSRLLAIAGSIKTLPP